MRRQTGEKLLARTPQLRPDGPALSDLVVRIMDSRGRPVAGSPTPLSPAPSAQRRASAPACSPPTPTFVSPPPAGRSAHTSPHTVDGVALLGAHGGAGVTSLLRAGLDQVATDADRRWPQEGPVVLVARTSTSGLEWARDLARQHASSLQGDVELLGLVLVADAPGRVPRRTAGLRDLVAGAFPRAWHVPWLEEWRLAASSEPLPAHPDVQHLTAELARVPQQHREHPFQTRLARTTSTSRDSRHVHLRGDLL